MTKILKSLIGATILTAAIAATPVLAGDVEAGAKVFKKCKACHVVDSQKNKTGPHLSNLIGRKAGTVESYKKYSKAMVAADIVWDAETLDAYLTAPKKYLKGTRMAFAGLRKEKDRDNVIAYLASFSN